MGLNLPVGTIDLQAHYTSLLEPPAPTTSPSATSSPLPPIPRFPGYRVPVKGQLQLVIKNGNSAALKLFLIPYDLAGLNRGGNGGRTFLRQKSYSVVVDENAAGTVAGSVGREISKGKLRYAVHIQFCSPPIPTPSIGKHEPRYYLYNTIRVVFASQALDSSEKLVVVSEGLEGVMGDVTAVDLEAKFAPYNGPGVEWEMARKKRKVKEKMWADLEKREEQEKLVALERERKGEKMAQDDEGPGDMDVDVDERMRVVDPDFVSDSYEAPSILERPLLNTPPSPSNDLPISLSALSHTLPSPLSFERNLATAIMAGGSPFPRKPPGRNYYVSSQKSGLASSRPGEESEKEG